jgi:hypothetical protein
MSLFINYDFNTGSEINTPDGKKIINTVPQYNNPEYYATNYGGLVGSSGVNNWPNAILLNSSSSQYIQLPQFETTNNGLTFACWFQSNNNGTWARIFDFGNGANSDNIILYINSGYIGFSVYKVNNKYQIDNVIPNMNDNAWNHIAWTLSPTNGWTIYLNGTLFINYSDGYYPNAGFRNNNYIGKSNWVDPYFNGGIQDFRIYNSVLADTDISTIYNKYHNVSSSIVFNDLYNEIYCNINSPAYRNGYKTLTNKAFNDDLNTLNTITTTSETNCLDNCYINPYCTSYKYNTNSQQNNCTLYDGFPSNTVDATGSNSGYTITKFGYPFTSLNDKQKSHVKKYCIKKYLGNTYPDTKNKLNDPNFLNISDNGNKTVIDIGAQNLYDKYNAVGINSMITVNNSTYTPTDPRSSTDSTLLSTNDSIIDNYGTIYKRYSDNITTIANNNRQATPTQNDISYLNNTVSPKNNTYYSQYSGSIDSKKTQILEPFENNINYNKIFIVLIIIFFIFLVLYILYKNK